MFSLPLKLLFRKVFEFRYLDCPLLDWGLEEFGRFELAGLAGEVEFLCMVLYCVVCLR